MKSCSHSNESMAMHPSQVYNMAHVDPTAHTRPQLPQDTKEMGDERARALIYKYDCQSWGIEAPRPGDIEIQNVRVDMALGDRHEVQ